MSIFGKYNGLTLRPSELGYLDHLNVDFADRLTKFFKFLAEKGFNFEIVQGLRTASQQLAIYRQGRDTPGKIITKAKPGQSYHEYGFAVDVYPFINNKRNDTSDKAWDHFRALATYCGQFNINSGSKWDDWYHLEDNIELNELRHEYPGIAQFGDKVYADYQRGIIAEIQTPVIVATPVGSSALPDRVPTNTVPDVPTNVANKRLGIKPVGKNKYVLDPPDLDTSDGYSGVPKSILTKIYNFIKQTF